MIEKVCFRWFSGILMMCSPCIGSTTAAGAVRVQARACDNVPGPWSSLFNAFACVNLLSLHDEFTPQYVVSSSWTGFLRREQICDVFLEPGWSLLLRISN
jgi:hypothetical protein